MLYIDRIEEEIVVCEDEDGRREYIDLAKFDGPVREGDCAVKNGERYTVDREATKARRRQLHQRFSALFKKNR